MEDESNPFSEPRARESDVTIGIVAIGGIDGPVRMMLRVGVVLFKEIDGFLSCHPVVVGWPRKILVRGIWGNSEKVMSLHQSSREGVDWNSLEVGRRGDELEDIIDVVPFDIGGIHFR